MHFLEHRQFTCGSTTELVLQPKDCMILPIPPSGHIKLYPLTGSSGVYRDLSLTLGHFLNINLPRYWREDITSLPQDFLKNHARLQ